MRADLDMSRSTVAELEILKGVSTNGFSLGQRLGGFLPKWTPILSSPTVTGDALFAGSNWGAECVCLGLRKVLEIISHWRFISFAVIFVLFNGAVAIIFFCSMMSSFARILV